MCLSAQLGEGASQQLWAAIDKHDHGKILDSSSSSSMALFEACAFSLLAGNFDTCTRILLIDASCCARFHAGIDVHGTVGCHSQFSQICGHGCGTFCALVVAPLGCGLG